VCMCVYAYIRIYMFCVWGFVVFCILYVYVCVVIVCDHGSNLCCSACIVHTCITYTHHTSYTHTRTSYIIHHTCTCIHTYIHHTSYTHLTHTHHTSYTHFIHQYIISTHTHHTSYTHTSYTQYINTNRKESMGRLQGREEI